MNLTLFVSIPDNLAADTNPVYSIKQFLTAQEAVIRRSLAGKLPLNVPGAEWAGIELEMVITPGEGVNLLNRGQEKDAMKLKPDEVNLETHPRV